MGSLRHQQLLIGGDVLEEVHIKGADLGIIGRDPGPFHFREGIVDEAGVEPGDVQGVLRIRLKYGPDGDLVIRSLERESKPGRRMYVQASGVERVLNGIGMRLQPDKLLESLVQPSAAIAEGFGTTTVEMKGGALFAGVITKDQDGAITLVDINGKSHQLLWDKIKSRSPSKASAMPLMGDSLSKRQLRDLIAFLKKQNK